MLHYSLPRIFRRKEKSFANWGLFLRGSKAPIQLFPPERAPTAHGAPSLRFDIRRAIVPTSLVLNTFPGLHSGGTCGLPAMPQCGDILIHSAKIWPRNKVNVERTKFGPGVVCYLSLARIFGGPHS